LIGAKYKLASPLIGKLIQLENSGELLSSKQEEKHLVFVVLPQLKSCGEIVFPTLRSLGPTSI